ncbi:WD40 repeat-like protein [Byssothecium circinans]|uniref:Ribosome biogenesis protein YTM1 n=1 Tax=Byssothecium circinans TaxID=147558 RepID=A0A6A5TMW3_9PLEO|nr:WD40 repeat-like protein [Byssothecium circinans]
MPSQVSDQQLGDAVLESVEYGSFPQSEHVASAEVSSAALPKLLAVVRKAREDTKNQIRQISRDASSDVDGWIAQARKLQDGIKRSQETAQEIVNQAESGKEKTERVQDAASKVSFLHSEIAYNESLVRVVEQLQDISILLESVQDAAVHSHIIHALERLEDADAAFKRLGPFENARVVGLLKTKADELRTAIVENVTEFWSGLIVVNITDRKITLKDTVERETMIHIDTVVEALTKLGHLDKFISRLSRDFDSVVISPRLSISDDQVVSALTIEGDDVQIAGHISDMSVKAALEDLHAISEYLSTRLPPAIATPLSEKLVPIIASRFIHYWLLPTVPLSTDDVPEFQEMLSLVLGLVEYLDELGWSGQKRLSDWVDKSAGIWLARQKEVAIARVQKIFPKRVQDKKTVERVETQIITKGDALHGGHDEPKSEPEKTEQDDDWGAEWGDEEPAKEEAKPAQADIEEEDVSAWGVEDDELQEESKEKPKTEPQETTEEDAEDWGADWGDDDASKPEPTGVAPKAANNHNRNGHAVAAQGPTVNEEITLRETYTVTAIPDSIIEIILQVVTDVGTLNSSELVSSAIAPASGGLYAIPSLLLAMYRATAATHYSRDVAANMLIYNDCTRLSDRLRIFLQEQAEKDSTSQLPQLLRSSVRLKPRLEEDIKAIEGFGKRAYGREMESQRTIIRDHLDAAQGFSGCTNMPFASECDNAIMMTIDRIMAVKTHYQPVLSHSALLQTLGSLVSTALSKFITDIEDMADIAEDESKKLHGYSQSLSSLSSLFQTEDERGEVREMAHMYVPNWLKFQYISEILDGSLADIRMFWVEGALSLEMESEEVCDLIRALFAESDYRRKAIADIRRGTLKRPQLSALVNSLLRPDEKPIPFDILVNGQFLRTTLDEFLTQNGISAETTLDVEYARAFVPPLNVSSFEHDDWVSAVDVWSGGSIQNGHEKILSASYDGLLRIWNTSGDVLATSEAPNNGGRITSLKTAKWISDTKVAAAGLDNTVRVYKFDEDNQTLTTTLELYSHKWGVEDLAVDSTSNRMLSASSDTTISLFSTNIKDNPAAPANLLPNSTAASNKRQKLSKPDKTVPARGALSKLTGHTSPVSSVVFKPDDNTVAYSASHDHSLKTWDLPTTTCVDTRTTGHSLLSLTALPKLNLLATGTSARHITLVDPRASATKISVMTLRGHKNAVVSLATDPESEYHLLSGSHDGTAMVWDVRSVRTSEVQGEGQIGESVYSIARDSAGGKPSHAHGEGVKVFDVCWDKSVGIVSAGEDKRIQINRALS